MKFIMEVEVEGDLIVPGRTDQVNTCVLLSLLSEACGEIERRADYHRGYDYHGGEPEKAALKLGDSGELVGSENLFLGGLQGTVKWEVAESAVKKGREDVKCQTRSCFRLLLGSIFPGLIQSTKQAVLRMRSRCVTRLRSWL